MKPLIDEQVLEGIPEELIRPLLAMCIRALQPHTAESYKQLLKETRRLGRACSAAGGQSLFYIDLENIITRRMYPMLDAQTWARKTDPTAEATSIEVDRWIVDVHSSGTNRALLVTYERAGIDRRTLEERARVIVTEASDRDL
jgi:hypothetical protein